MVYLHLVDFYGFHVGKYNSPMDGVGMFEVSPPSLPFFVASLATAFLTVLWLEMLCPMGLSCSVFQVLQQLGTPLFLETSPKKRLQDASETKKKQKVSKSDMTLGILTFVYNLSLKSQSCRITSITPRTWKQRKAHFMHGDFFVQRPTGSVALIWPKIIRSPVKVDSQDLNGNPYELNDDNCGIITRKRNCA